MRCPLFVRPIPLVFGMCGMLTACDFETSKPRGPGSIAVAASLTTGEPMLIEYGVSIDSGTPRMSFSNLPLIFIEHGLAAGRHVVALTGDLPSTCGTSLRREVELRGDDTANVVLSVQCARITGDLHVSVVTTGSDPDPNGYFVMVNQVMRGVVAPNSSTIVPFVQPGSYSVSLSDVGANCTASGAQTVQVTASVQSSASFTVTCAPVAVLRFVVATTGADRDPDGPVVQVDNGAAQRLPVNGTANVRVPNGTHTYSVSDLQPNCTLAGASSGTHTLAQHDTVTITIDASCVAISVGDVGVIGTDPGGDTLSNGNTLEPPAFDILGLTGRYATGFAIVVVRFNRAVTSAATESASSIYGYLNIDTDESASTGISPASNFFGGNATMGSDYHIALFFADTASAELFRTPGPSEPFISVGRVRIRYDADSMLVFLPLDKIASDQNAAVTLVVGTGDRPTDVAPNAGTFLLRPPAAPVVAGMATRRSGPEARGRTVPASVIGKWRIEP